MIIGDDADWTVQQVRERGGETAEMSHGKKQEILETQRRRVDRLLKKTNIIKTASLFTACTSAPLYLVLLFCDHSVNKVLRTRSR